MPKTKTQAEKRQEREARSEQNLAEKTAQREATALQLRQQLEEQKKLEAIPQGLSKKEQRKQKKERAQATQAEFLLPAQIPQGSESANTTEPAKIVSSAVSYCEGLKPVLTRLQKALPSCRILPGEVLPEDDYCEELELRFQRLLEDRTFQFLARTGHNFQAV